MHRADDPLVRRLAGDFDALQAAVLARMAGTATPGTLRALDDPVLYEPIAGALAHAEVLARGRIRRARLTEAAPDRLLALHERALALRRERSAAERLCRAHRPGLPRSAPTWDHEVRLARQAYPCAFAAALRDELAARGLPEDAVTVPSGPLYGWAVARGLLPAERPPEPVRELMACQEEEFVRVLLRDAAEAENPHLTHAAVVERWDRAAPFATAWARRAIAEAEIAVRAHGRGPSRLPLLDRLDGAYQDAAVLAARAHEARHLRIRLRNDILSAAQRGPHADLVRACHEGAYARFGDAKPFTREVIRRVVATHRAYCPERGDGCRDCVRTMADLVPGERTWLDRQARELRILRAGNAHAEPFARVDDLPPDAPVVVADAALGADSAVCGYGWAGADGHSGSGVGFASTTGEAEVVAICHGALASLARHPGARVAVLCDSVQAVVKVRHTLDPATEPGGGHAEYPLVFPETRALLESLRAHRGRVEVRWLKGHTGHRLNRRADALARAALRRALGHIPDHDPRRETARVRRAVERSAAG